VLVFLYYKVLGPYLLNLPKENYKSYKIYKCYNQINLKITECQESINVIKYIIVIARNANDEAIFIRNS